MRKFRLRIWDKEDEGYWNDPLKDMAERDQYDDSYSMWSVAYDVHDGDTSRFVMQQYVGLEDKNEKEIYEGDIVTNKTKDFNGNGFRGKNLIMLVEWDQDECFYKLHIKSKGSFGYKKLTKASAKDIEVIGNIFEQSELL